MWYKACFCHVPAPVSTLHWWGPRRPKQPCLQSFLTATILSSWCRNTTCFQSNRRRHLELNDIDHRCPAAPSLIRYWFDFIARWHHRRSPRGLSTLWPVQCAPSTRLAAQEFLWVYPKPNGSTRNARNGMALHCSSLHICSFWQLVSRDWSVVLKCYLGFGHQNAFNLCLTKLFFVAQMKAAKNSFYLEKASWIDLPST